ncbi:MAG: aspartate kinase [Rickettsiales bacterium]|nr:aspartate kinase [Rickettsiales bacterium]|tara:strand:+ start:1428 stop:2651 length:1224 start_codon:yes stop_codon:yes gene_type:complete
MSKKKIIVKKFGGTSVGSVDRIKAVAKKAIDAKDYYDDVVIVVSAMGKTTNQLVTLAKEISDNPSPREYDALISTGENVSASLLAMCIQEMGKKAISLSGFQAGILTETLHSKAKIIDIHTERIEKELNDNNIVIITGFQGFSPSADVTTIGRGGSDTSAVALAASLKSNICEIYTDVDGVYTTDPRKLDKAKKINEISYDEMLELASLGAKVLHPRAVECAKENNITLHVRSSFEDVEGTYVKEAKNLEVTIPVTGIAFSENEAIVSVHDIPDHPGAAGILFSSLAESGINIDMIIQSAEKQDKNTISFSVMQDDLTNAKKIAEKVSTKLNATKVTSKTAIAKISAVGVGMISRPGIAARMFTILGEANINILRITTSEIKISCAIYQDQLEKAIELLHKEFELDH